MCPRPCAIVGANINLIQFLLAPFVMSGNEVSAATDGVEAAAASPIKDEHDLENPSQPPAGRGTPTSPDAVVTATNYATRLAYYMPTGEL